MPLHKSNTRAEDFSLANVLDAPVLRILDFMKCGFRFSKLLVSETKLFQKVKGKGKLNTKDWQPIWQKHGEVRWWVTPVTFGTLGSVAGLNRRLFCFRRTTRSGLLSDSSSGRSIGIIMLVLTLPPCFCNLPGT